MLIRGCLTIAHKRISVPKVEKVSPCSVISGERRNVDEVYAVLEALLAPFIHSSTLTVTSYLSCSSMTMPDTSFPALLEARKAKLARGSGVSYKRIKERDRWCLGMAHRIPFVS